MKMTFKNPVFSWTLKRRKFGNTKIQKCKPTKRKAMDHSWQCKRCQGKIPDLLLSDTISSSSDAISYSSDRLLRGHHTVMSWWTWLPICTGLCLMSGRFLGELEKLHFWHLFRFSPLWLRRWLFRVSARLNELPHCFQWCGSSPLCLLRCDRKIEEKSHHLHWFGFSKECVLMWSLRWPACEDA